MRTYVKERYKSAIQLIKNIEQRKQTIVKVCYAIIGRQRDFLDFGIDQLKPMMIKEVAEEIGVHPSTVSRAVANKYAHTPQGVFELRYFFSESVNGPEGSNTSLLILKRRVKKLIEEEDPARPLTDEQITRILQSQGIQVTRRTVAKYREDMRHPEHPPEQSEKLGLSSPWPVPARGKGGSMNVEYTGRQYEVTPAVRKQIDQGLSKLHKILGTAFNTNVILAAEKHRHIAEITITVRTHPIVGIAEAGDMSSAVGEALDRIERQALKYKGRWRDKKRQPKKKWNGEATAAEQRAAVGDKVSTAVPVVVHTYPAVVRIAEAHVTRDDSSVAPAPAHPGRSHQGS